MVRIGFVGLGTMGAPMVQHLLAAGHELTVYNRTQARAAGVVGLGAEWAPNTRILVGASDVVLTCLGGEATEATYCAGSGLLSFAQPGQVFVEHGTITRALAIELQRRASAVGADFIDAPVTGGPAGAANGDLIAMVGGEPQSVNKVRVYLRAYCSTVEHVGPTSSGVGLKLVNQLLAGIHMVAASEAFALIEHLDIDIAPAGRVLSHGWGASLMLDRKVHQTLRSEFANTGATTAAFVDTLELVRDTLDAADLKSAVFRGAMEALEEMVAAGYGALDPTALQTK